MPTTRPDLAWSALDALDDLGLRYAILHGEDRAAAGSASSDLDVAVDRRPEEVVRALVRPLGEAGLRLAMLWPYDVNALTTFWLTPEGPEGVQLDLIHDPEGTGKYGVRTDVLIDRRERGARWWRLDPGSEWVYLVAKRSVKGDQDRLQRLLGDSTATAGAGLIGATVAGRRYDELTGLVTGRRLPADVGGSRQPRRDRLRRVTRRLVEPVGYWVVADEGSTERAALAAGFRRVLPRARAVDGAGAAILTAAWTERRRPGLVISRRLPGVTADIRLPSGAPGAATVVAGMEACARGRLLRRLERRR